MRRPRQWVFSPRSAPVTEADKAAIIAGCEALLRDVILPRHLAALSPDLRPGFVNLHGAWSGGRYRFVRRLRDAAGMEFNMPFARLDRIGPNCFDLYWMRHTGSWWRLHAGLTLAEALHLLEHDALLRPVA